MKIKYSKKETRNLGNYENVTVEISVEDTVDAFNETQEECFLRLRDFVINRLPIQFTQSIQSQTKTEEIDLEVVKNKVVKLIDKDENNRQVIKSMLASYNATILQDLNFSQLKEVNNKLIKLYDQYK